MALRIFHSPGPASCRWCRLNSNVRRLTPAMSARVASSPAVLPLGPGHANGAAVKYSVPRAFSAHGNARPVCTLWPASLGKEQQAQVLHHLPCGEARNLGAPGVGYQRVSSSYRRRPRQSGTFKPFTRRLENQDGRPCCQLGPCGSFGHGHKSKLKRGVAVVMQEVRPPFPRAKTPNPSSKPSPNSKTPGRRANPVYHLARRPGVLLPVPA